MQTIKLQDGALWRLPLWVFSHSLEQGYGAVQDLCRHLRLAASASSDCHLQISTAFVFCFTSSWASSSNRVRMMCVTVADGQPGAPIFGAIEFSWLRGSWFFERVVAKRRIRRR